MAMLPIFNVYYVYFCGLRQILGLAILFMGVLYVLNEKKRKWYVFAFCVFLGYEFHTSIAIYAVIFAISYFIRFRSRLLLLSALIISALLGIVLQSFDVMQAFNFFLSLNIEETSRIENYMQDGQDLNSITSLFFSLRPTIIAVFVFAFMDKAKLNHWLSLIYVTGVILGNLFISVPMVNRLTGGLVVLGPIVFTWIFAEDYRASVRLRKYTNIAVVVFLLYFSQMYFKNNLNSLMDLTAASRMHPYQFIWEDYSNHPSIKYFK